MTKQVEPVYRAIAIRIEMLRDTLGLSQGELAKRSGISRPALANIECGRQRISVHQIEAFAEAMSTTPKNLLKGIWF
ncbi:MAG: helix-turn-helix transcriptional regulator [Alphaproteobacteria bacterium]|nr:helix-turn-helix transcriptional regulator [Alphaproteobacteria bacterium]